MKLNKTIALAAALLLAAISLFGCGAKTVPAAMVGDQEITVTQLSNAYYNSQSYASYYGYDTTTDEGIEAYREYILGTLIDTAVRAYKAKAAGIELTAEEMDQAKATAASNYDSTLQSFVDQATQAGATNVDAYAKTLFTKALVSNKTTVSKLKAQMLEDAVNDLLVSKHRTALLEGVTLSDEELMAKYDEELAAQKEAFDATPSQYFTYESYSLYGYNAPPLYVPDGFFRVRHILVADELTANIVESKIAEGEDFEALLSEYNTDPGMDSPENKDGYLVGEGASFVESFLTASLALTKDGDVSAPVESEYGWHIIKRVSTEPAHEIPYEDVKDLFDMYELSLYQDQYYNDIVSGWIADDTLVTRFPENYASVGKS